MDSQVHSHPTLLPNIRGIVQLGSLEFPVGHVSESSDENYSIQEGTIP